MAVFIINTENIYFFHTSYIVLVKQTVVQTKNQLKDSKDKNQ